MLLEDGEDLLRGIIQKFERQVQIRNDRRRSALYDLYFDCLCQVHSRKSRRTMPINICYSSPYMGFPGGSVVKKSPANAGVSGSIPESGISPGEVNGNPVQYSCLENPMDRGA